MNKLLKKIFIGTMLISNWACAQEECNFSKLIEKRHSGYAFNATKSISKDQMIKLAEAANFAPSSYNDQPWKFIFCDKVQTPKAYDSVLQSLVEPNQKWAKDAPLLIIVLADNISSYNQKLNRFSEYDTGAAAISLVFEATNLGLMAHQMGGYDMDKIKTNFSIPNNLTPMAVIAIGYEKDNESIPSKKRRSLNESFFLGELNKSISDSIFFNHS